jgi:hypothetical protein
MVGRGCITLARQHPRVVAAKDAVLEEALSLFHPCVLFTYLGRDILELFKCPDEGGNSTCFNRSI